MASVRRKNNKGALQDLLLKACPANEDGVRSIPILAKKLGCTTQTIYYWLTADKVPVARAQELVRLGKGELVRIEEFYPFIFRSAN